MKHRCKDTKNWAKKQNNIKKRLKKDIEQGFRQSLILRCSDAVLQFVEMPSLSPKIYLYIYIYILYI